MNPFSQLIGLALVVHVIVIVVGTSIDLGRKCHSWFERTKALPSYMIVGVVTSIVLMMTMKTFVESVKDTHSNIRMAGDFVEAVVTTHEVPTTAYAQSQDQAASAASAFNLMEVFQSFSTIQILVILVAAMCAALHIRYSRRVFSPESPS